MQHTTGILTGLRNTCLFTRQWTPDVPPRAVVALAHGLAEHSGRYDHVAAFLTARGYVLAALDHRGHGRSEGERLEIERFDDFVTDLWAYVTQVKAQYSGLPLFLYGHSMGSLIVLRAAIRHQDALAGLIVTGVALRVAGINAVTAAALGLASRARPQAALIPALAAGGISHDPAVVERYDTDPLVYRGRLRVRLVSEMIRAGAACIADLPTLRLPVLALHGGADPLCLPAGAEIVRTRCGSADTTVTIYDGLYHEVHNEPEQGAVLADLAAWLDAHT